ncbi:MAG: hypothetical protein HY731_05900 [Candidatus Tectomicrobia bacterium]|nr:hypothetical protein [Candidatus Tectomicrobia bacterium]
MTLPRAEVKGLLGIEPERLAWCPHDYLADARILEAFDEQTTMHILPKHRFVFRTLDMHVSNITLPSSVFVYGVRLRTAQEYTG